MAIKLVLAGDVNLMNVTDPDVPFHRVRTRFENADVVFCNLECCLYDPPQSHSEDNEGFYIAPDIGGRVLARARVDAVGIANNVNYGTEAIASSIAELDRFGIAHTGAGPNLEWARMPAIVERDGMRIGFVQRTSVYWPTHHEARSTAAGVATIRGHTAYQLPLHKTRADTPPANRPGLPPVIVTWADRAYLQSFVDDIAALRSEVDVVVASCHWGLWQEVLAYMEEIAHAAIDAGADIVMGHGPHYSLPVEVYRGKPIFYGLGSFSFHTGHGGRKHGDWVGLMATVSVERERILNASVEFARHNDDNETVLCPLADEHDAMRDLIARSERYGTRLIVDGDALSIVMPSASS